MLPSTVGLLLYCTEPGAQADRALFEFQATACVPGLRLFEHSDPSLNSSTDARFVRPPH